MSTHKKRMRSFIQERTTKTKKPTVNVAELMHRLNKAKAQLEQTEAQLVTAVIDWGKLRKLVAQAKARTMLSGDAETYRQFQQITADYAQACSNHLNALTAKRVETVECDALSLAIQWANQRPTVINEPFEMDETADEKYHVATVRVPGPTGCPSRARFVLGDDRGLTSRQTEAHRFPGTPEGKTEARAAAERAVRNLQKTSDYTLDERNAIFKTIKVWNMYTTSLLVDPVEERDPAYL